MDKYICDLCKNQPATLVDKTIINNGVVEYHFCKDCYKSILDTGMTAFQVMQEILARKGKECESCDTTAKDFSENFKFGCADCYRDMREIAQSAIYSCQGSVQHTGKVPYVKNQNFNRGL